MDHFQWVKPEEFAKFEAVLLGWASVINGSEFLRTTAGRCVLALFYVLASSDVCDAYAQKTILYCSSCVLVDDIGFDRRNRMYSIPTISVVHQKLTNIRVSTLVRRSRIAWG